jgi:hypothetical protein
MQGGWAREKYPHFPSRLALNSEEVNRNMALFESRPSPRIRSLTLHTIVIPDGSNYRLLPEACPGSLMIRLTDTICGPFPTAQLAATEDRRPFAIDRSFSAAAFLAAYLTSWSMLRHTDHGAKNSAPLCAGMSKIRGRQWTQNDGRRGLRRPRASATEGQI